VNALSVIREDANLSLRVRHRAKFSELLAFKPNSYRTNRVDICVARFTTEGRDLLDDSGGVSDRAGVCHGVNRGKSAHSSCLSSGQNRFALFKPRLTQVGVQIYEARERNQSGAVDDFDT
jgi:hypothetical protein